MKVCQFKLTPRNGKFISGIFPGKIIKSLYDVSVATGYLELAAYPDGYQDRSDYMIDTVVKVIQGLGKKALAAVHKIQSSSELNSSELDEMNITIQERLHDELNDDHLWPMPTGNVESTLNVPDDTIKTLNEIAAFMKEMSPSANTNNKVSDRDALEQLESDLMAYEQFGIIGCSNLIKRTVAGKQAAGTLVTGILRMKNSGMDDNSIKRWIKNKSDKAMDELGDEAFASAEVLSREGAAGQLAAQEKNISVMAWLTIVGILGGYDSEGKALTTTNKLSKDIKEFCDVMRKCLMIDRSKRRVIIEASGSSFTKKVWTMARTSLRLNCCTLILSETRMVQTCVVTGLGTALSNIRNVKADTGFVRFLCEMWLAIESVPEDPRLKKDDFKMQVASLLQHSLVSAGNCFHFSIKMSGRASDVRIKQGN
ncbi:hypothetical protein [Wuhan pillworm virus 1]|uniref:hypothetical protein n=1 Tax=Wuhan pillworm virus 1 TaxID=1923744 RepID=UPI00090955DF|nr:hypothetical protein [Wuhan pillworm virus 1]APG79339.1 hypothetical protein [Wuhan pillworm virus 1]